MERVDREIRKTAGRVWFKTGGELTWIKPYLSDPRTTPAFGGETASSIADKRWGFDAETAAEKILKRSWREHPNTKFEDRLESGLRRLNVIDEVSAIAAQAWKNTKPANSENSNQPVNLSVVTQVEQQVVNALAAQNREGYLFKNVLFEQNPMDNLYKPRQFLQIDLVAIKDDFQIKNSCPIDRDEYDKVQGSIKKEGIAGRYAQCVTFENYVDPELRDTPLVNGGILSKLAIRGVAHPSLDDPSREEIERFVSENPDTISRLETRFLLTVQGFVKRVIVPQPKIVSRADVVGGVPLPAVETEVATETGFKWVEKQVPLTSSDVQIIQACYEMILRISEGSNRRLI